GWERHGGGGNGNLNGVGNNYLKLDRDDTLRRSNRIYFAPDVTAVKFDWQIQNQDDDDFLQISIGSRILANLELDQTHSDFQRNIIVPLNFEHEGFVDMLQFQIINRNSDFGRSGVRIDNVELIAGSPTVGLDAAPADDAEVADAIWSESLDLPANAQGIKTRVEDVVATELSPTAKPVEDAFVTDDPSSRRFDSNQARVEPIRNSDELRDEAIAELLSEATVLLSSRGSF
ncbi:MAG: hypothetical protein AAFU85_05885, partial [Planctomycetota bacterium]